MLLEYLDYQILIGNIKDDVYLQISPIKEPSVYTFYFKINNNIINWEDSHLYLPPVYLPPDLKKFCNRLIANQAFF